MIAQGALSHSHMAELSELNETAFEFGCKGKDTPSAQVYSIGRYLLPHFHPLYKIFAIFDL